jgi:hypothetical protein
MGIQLRVNGTMPVPSRLSGQLGGYVVKFCVMISNMDFCGTAISVLLIVFPVTQFRPSLPVLKDHIASAEWVVGFVLMIVLNSP